MTDPAANPTARRPWLVTGTAAALFAALLASLAAPPAALSGEYEDAVERGRLLVEERCARCHAVGRDGASPFPEAPPFHEIVARYPVEGLAEAFAEGITVGHPAMPEFVLPPEEITDLLTYLDDLTR